MGDKYTTSPWLTSPRDEKKIFCLAGFFENEQIKATEMERMKTDITKKIKDLGGVVITSESWDPSITHVVAYVDTRKEGMSEKVMGGIAAGRWVVTQRYIEKSAKAGQFLPSPHNYSSCYKDAVISSRKRYHDMGRAKGGIFSGIKAVTVMADERKRSVYMRILAAGGATVLKEIQTPRQLSRSEIFSKGDKIVVFMDPEQKKDRYLIKVKDEKSLKFLSFKYIFGILKDYSETKEENYEPFNVLTSHNAGKRNLPTLDGANKRPRRNSNNNAHDREVVCLSDDEMEDGEISVEDSDDDIIAIVDNTQKPVREKPTVEEVEVDDSDDDIEVLEEKLKKSRQQRGNSRQYLDTNKAKPAARIPVDTIDIDEEMEDITLVEPARSESPDIVEMEREDTDDEDVESVLHKLDNTISDIDQGLVPAPLLVIDEDPDDDITEVPHEDHQVPPEIIEPSLDDFHRLSSTNSSLTRSAPLPGNWVPSDRGTDVVPSWNRNILPEVELSTEIVEPTLQISDHSSDKVFKETVEPSLDISVAAQKPSTSIEQPQDDASIRMAIEDLAASDCSTDDVGTIVELIQGTSPRSDKENHSPKRLSSSLFSERIKAKEREAVSTKEIKRPVIQQDKPAPEPIGKEILLKEPIIITPQKPVQEAIIANKPQNQNKTPIVPSRPEVTRVAEPLIQSEVAPKPFTGSKTDKSEKTLDRILGTILKRMAITDEGIAVGNINARTVKFDKHGERRLVRKCPVSQVDNQMVMDFKDTLNCDTANSSSAKQKFNVGKANKQHTASDAITVMRRLERETSSSRQPTPFLLNSVLTRLLLREENRDVRNISFHYLDSFLLLHLNNPSRQNWLHLFLSACRNCPDEKTFKTFDLSNIHDLRACWSFFSAIIKEVLIMLTNEDDEEDSGPIMFLDAIVKIVHRDFDYWWKHTRPKQSSTDTTQYPILFYLLGGSGNNLLSNIKSSALALFTWSLKKGGRKSTSIRKLMSMCALLMSHQDSIQGQSLVSSGLKVELANAVGRGMKEASLGPRDTQVELALLQPNWFSAAVSKSLLCGHHSVDMSRGVSGVITSMASLNLGSPEIGLVMENYCHKLLAHQHAHTIFRANWHFVRNKDKEFRAFRMMNKLEEKGVPPNSRMIRLEEIAVKQSSIIDSVNTIRNFSNKKPEESDNASNNENSCAAMLFRMKTADKF